MFQRSAALPDVERPRGTEHGGKAESEEKAQKSLSRKTCMAWCKLYCLKPSSKLVFARPVGRAPDDDASLASDKGAVALPEPMATRTFEGRTGGNEPFSRNEKATSP